MCETASLLVNRNPSQINLLAAITYLISLSNGCLTRSKKQRGVNAFWFLNYIWQSLFSSSGPTARFYSAWVYVYRSKSHNCWRRSFFYPKNIIMFRSSDTRISFHFQVDNLYFFFLSVLIRMVESDERRMREERKHGKQCNGNAFAADLKHE